MRKLSTIFTCTLLSTLSLLSASAQEVDYTPEIHGSIRGKFEYQNETKEGRFQARNARFSVSGYVLPSVSYKAEIDLSDQGQTRMLDAYSRIAPISNLSFSIGQMRVPFTIDAHRSPHSRYFANRSFIGKQVGDVRDVGAVVAYSDKDGKVPYILEAGVFNGDGLTQQGIWHKTFTYSAKGQFWFKDDWNLTLSTQMMKPSVIRINMYDAGTYYDNGSLHLEAEYLYKTYAENAFGDVHSLDLFGFYKMHINGLFDNLIFLGRFDTMTNHSDGYMTEAEIEKNILAIDDAARQRLTGGLTFAFEKDFVAELRLNYEKYFYESYDSAALQIINPSERDKFVIELMCKF